MILGNRKDFSAPFPPVSDWQEYCVSDCIGSMRRNSQATDSAGMCTVTTEATKKCPRNMQGGSMRKAMCCWKGKCVDFDGFEFF